MKTSSKHSQAKSSGSLLRTKNRYYRDAMAEQPGNLVRSWSVALSGIENALNTRPQDRRSYLSTAREIMASLDNIPQGIEPLLVDDQIRTVAVLQSLAYRNADNGAPVDISTWCERQWATILQSHPNNFRALQGFFHACLLYKITRLMSYRFRSGMAVEKSRDSCKNLF